MSIAKMRGVDYFEGLHSISISQSGISVFPRVKTPPALSFSLSSEKLATGVSGLDQMMEGGVPAGSSTLIAGGTGTGKTTLSLHFLMEGAKREEPGLLVSFQEPPDQLKMIAKCFSWDIEKEIAEKKLFIFYTSPVELDLDQHAFLVKEKIEEMGIKRVVVDSLMDIELAAFSDVHFRDHIYSLVNFFKSQGVTSVLTNELTEVFGGARFSDYGISFIVDNLILLGYKKEESSIKREITLLKMRGSGHKRGVNEFEITNEGVVIQF